MFKTMCRKTAAFFMALMLVVSYASFNFQPLNVSAAEIVDQPNAFKTTLKDRTTKSDRLTFDIWARDENGQKLSADTIKVTNNGVSVRINWDDSEKTSYTLYLTNGENKIKIIVNGDIIVEKEFTISKLPAEDGEHIGEYIMSLDGFTVGLGYIIEPTRMPIYKGQNAAMLLVDQLDKHGYNYTNTGSVESSFYLASITKKEGSIYDVGVKIPEEIENLGLNVDPDDHFESLGEFDFNYMSGWMYKLNNVFPNVGFADSYLQADDVMAVQFTVGYGSDLGGGWEQEFFPVINRDEITRQLAYINSSRDLKAKFLADPAIKEAYDQQMEIMAKFGLEQSVINKAEHKMTDAIVKYVDEKILEVSKDISNITSIKIKELETLISNITSKQFEELKNKEIYYSIIDKNNKLEEVNLEISKLPEIENVSLGHRTKIEKVRKLYDALSESLKKEVKGIERLIGVEKKLVFLQGIEDFNSLTYKLPKVNKITLQDEKKINQALEAFEKLTEEQRNLVKKEDLNNLLEAKKRLDDLIAQAKVDEVFRLINELPVPSQLTLQDEDVILNTLSQFNALTKEQQSLVSNKSNLDLLVTTLENLKLYDFNAQITRVNELIEVLPDFINVDISSEKQVELITEKYNALSKEQQVHIKGYEKVAQYDQKIQMLKAKSVEVFEQIAKLPEASSVKVTDRDAIEKVRTAFSNLTAGQKNLVTNHQKLDAVEKALAQLESKTILDLVIGILALPEASVATEAVQGEVFTLRAKYNQLNKTQQSMITNYEKLVKVEEKLKNLAEINTVEAEKVITLIAKLPTTITLDQQSQIEDARSAYENLTIPQQSVVTNYEMLADAEEALLPLVEKEQKAAYKVTSMIDALPSKVTTDHEAAVNSVRKAFNGLTTSQKKLVKNEAVLVEAEKAIKKLQNIVAITSKNAKMDIPTITNLSTTVSGTASKSTKVYVYNGSKRLAYATVSKNGKYSMKIAKQKKGAKLKFVQRNSDKKVVKTTYVTVKGAKVKTPYSVKASATKVTGKASKAKTVAIYKGSKKISSVAVKSNGTFTAKITKQKKGVKLSVYAYDSVKNKSEKKVVSVK